MPAAGNVPPAPGATGPVGIEGGVYGFEQTWHNWMIRDAITNPKLIQNGAAHLDIVDRITRRKSNLVPFGQ